MWLDLAIWEHTFNPMVMNLVEEAIQSGNSFDIENVELFDGEERVSLARVCVREGWITAVEKAPGERIAERTAERSAVRTIDGRGLFLMPSLIDYEGHYSSPSDMLLSLVSSESASLRERLSKLMSDGLIYELDTHGLNPGHGRRPTTVGKRVEIPATSNFEKHIRFGVTTVIDQGSFPWPANYVKRSRGKWEADHSLDLRKEFLIYADLFSSGMWAAPAGLQFAYFGTDPVYNSWSEADYASWVNRRVQDGSDHIKIFYEKWGGADAPQLTLNSLQQLTKAAQARGLKVIVHSGTFETTEHIIDARADGGIHTPTSPDAAVISRDLAKRFAETVKVLTPTMSVMLSECNGPHSLANPDVLGKFLNQESLPYLNALDELRLTGDTWESENVDRYLSMFETVARLCEAGAILTTGSDSGSFGPYVEGLTVHHEMYLISEAIRKFSKLDPIVEALKAGTSNAAKAYGLTLGSRIGDPRGYIRPGYRADMILLRKSPFEDICNTLKIHKVFKAGYVANRQPVRPSQK